MVVFKQQGNIIIPDNGISYIMLVKFYFKENMLMYSFLNCNRLYKNQ